METTTLIPQRWRGAAVPSFGRAIDQLFNNWFSDLDVEPFRGFETTNGFFAPKIDVTENDKEVRVIAELPGIVEKDIDLQLNKDTLTLKGEKKEEKEEKSKDYYRRERRFGAFRQEIVLPSEVAQDKIEAVFKNGVLTVTLPKTTQAQREAKKIEIKHAA